MYFSEYFNVSKDILNDYCAYDISIVADTPLFIDPFLLFNSNKKEYRILHDEIINYLRFLKNKSINNKYLSEAELCTWYLFREVKQTWLGFTVSGNRGLGLNIKFAYTLHNNLNKIFKNFGDENITSGTHLEKLCLIEGGVGKDKISDFTTNLIKKYLLDYTSKFALEYISKDKRKVVNVPRVKFNPTTESFVNLEYELPFFNDFILLTPMDILTRDDIWINRSDLISKFENYIISESLPNEVLRTHINEYFYKIIPKKPSKKDKRIAIEKILKEFPQLIDFFIKYKEDNGVQAVKYSSEKVEYSYTLFVKQFGNLINLLESETDFYKIEKDTFSSSLERCKYLKHVIENMDGYRLLYYNGIPIKREDDLHILFKFTWFYTRFDFSHGVNNGRGISDFKISYGSKDKTIVEFKLASNPQLKRNLKNQAEIYRISSSAKNIIKVILFFTKEEEKKVLNILNELGIAGAKNIILIDARNDNKPPASRA